MDFQNPKNNKKSSWWILGVLCLSGMGSVHEKLPQKKLDMEEDKRLC